MTFKCPACNSVVYSGDRSIESIRLIHPEAVVGKIVVDHISPVVPVDKTNPTWDEIINGMFCEEDNLQPLCEACHLSKCVVEAQERAQTRKKSKKSEEI